MKKSTAKILTRVLAVVLVCALVVGFILMAIPAKAAGSETVQVMGHNVYFDDYLQIMYAVYVPEGQTVEKIVLSDGTNEFKAVPYLENDEQVTVTINEKSCLAYVADTGVSLHSIDTIVTASIYVGGTVVATDEYSVLQYLHKRLTVDEATEEQDAMYQSLLDAAEKMQVVVKGSVTLNNFSYVSVTNGTVDGTKTEGMVAVGTTLSGVTSTLDLGENQEIVWTVTEYTNGVAGFPVEMTTADVQAIEVEEGVNLTLVASLKDTSVEEPEVIANGNFIVVANSNAAMGLTLNSSKKIEGVAVNVYNGAVTTDGAPEWTVTNTTGGVTLFNGENYLAYSSGTNLALQAEEYVWAVELGETGEIYLNASTDTSRGLLYRDGDNNIFGGYATSNADTSGYHRAMLFMVYEKCEHNGNLVNYEAPTCGEAGYSGDTVCSICGALMAPGEILEATGEHNYVDGACSVCGAADPDAGTGSTPRYVKVTSADDLTSGTYVIVYTSSGDRAMTTYNNKWVLNTTAPTVTNGEIAVSDVDASMVWTLTVSGSTVVMTDSNGATIKPSSETANGLGTDSNNAYAWTFAFADGTFTFAGKSAGVMLAANAQSSHNLRAYKNSTASGYPHLFTLYKLVEE